VIRPELSSLLERSGLAPLRLGGRCLLPIVQGGMGIGVSAHRLAGTVAAQGGVGTLSSVDLRRHHPDLMERTRGLGFGADAKQAIDAANLEALEREVKAARQIAGNFGMLAMNVMRAVSDYAAYVRRSLESGIDAIVVGAGLPLDLPTWRPITRRSRWCRSCPTRAVCSWWYANGNARSACRTPSCSSTRHTLVGTLGRRASRT
jgi:nitronate monooxygenase